MKPVPEVVGVTDGLMPQVSSGDVRAIFVLVRMADGSYWSDYATDDIADMRYELGSEVMRLKTED